MIAIVGGGLAGATAATLLAREGRRVRLLERQAEPAHKVCGEFLSGPAAAMIRRLGIDPVALGAVPVDRLRLAWQDRVIEARLPFVAYGLTRLRLDAALLEGAAAAGAEVSRGIAVRAVQAAGLETGAGPVAARTVLLANGKHDVRGAGRDPQGRDTAFVGFKTYWRLPSRALAPLDGAIEVVQFEGGYAGLQRVEGGLANLCLVVTKHAFAEAGGTWAGLRTRLLDEPHLARRLDDGEELLPRPLTIAGIPYGFIHRGDPGDRVFRIGDQAAVIPSFCGDGMAIALGTARAAAETILAGGTAADHHRRLGAAVRRPIRLACAVQHVAERQLGRRLLWQLLSRFPSAATLLASATRAYHEGPVPARSRPGQANDGVLGGVGRRTW